MIPIFGDTREEVWLKAIDHLLNGAEDHIEYNLIMEVANPDKSTLKSRAIRKQFDAMLKAGNQYPVHTVAETIFPSIEYRKYGLDGVTSVYPEKIYPLIKSGSGNIRGTYAYRIVRGLNARGEECKPLDETIGRLKAQLKHPGGIRCAFEISVDDVQTIPINRNDRSVRGFPCLSHLSFKLSRDRTQLHLSAVYRSQDYIQKALGNLLGLARLQSCVSRELGLEPGKLVCHSTLARLDYQTGIGKVAIKALLDKIGRDFDGCE